MVKNIYIYVYRTQVHKDLSSQGDLYAGVENTQKNFRNKTT